MSDTKTVDVKDLALKRISYLSKLILDTHSINQKLSRYYAIELDNLLITNDLKDMRSIIATQQHVHCCPSCGNVLVPPINCTVRIFPCLKAPSLGDLGSSSLQVECVKQWTNTQITEVRVSCGVCLDKVTLPGSTRRQKDRTLIKKSKISVPFSSNKAKTKSKGTIHNAAKDRLNKLKHMARTSTVAPLELKSYESQRNKNSKRRADVDSASLYFDFQVQDENLKRQKSAFIKKEKQEEVKKEEEQEEEEKKEEEKKDDDDDDDDVNPYNLFQSFIK